MIATVLAAFSAAVLGCVVGCYFGANLIIEMIKHLTRLEVEEFKGLVDRTK